MTDFKKKKFHLREGPLLKFWIGHRTLNKEETARNKKNTFSKIVLEISF